MRNRVEGACAALGGEAEVASRRRLIRLRAGWERIADEVELRRFVEHDQDVTQRRADTVGAHADGMSVCLHTRDHQWPSR